MDYQIVTGTVRTNAEKARFRDAVKSLISRGYVPSGGVAFNQQSGELYQALIETSDVKASVTNNSVEVATETAEEEMARLRAEAEQELASRKTAKRKGRPKGSKNKEKVEA